MSIALNHVSRVVLVRNAERTYETREALDVQIDLQDSGRTLKVFVKVPEPGYQLSKVAVVTGRPRRRHHESDSAFDGRVQDYLKRIVDQVNSRKPDPA
jgi:hypothetical protein